MIDWISNTPAWLHPFPQPVAMWMTWTWIVAAFIVAHSVGRIYRIPWAGVAIGTMLLLGGLWLGVLPLGLTILGLLGVVWMEYG